MDLTEAGGVTPSAGKLLVATHSQDVLLGMLETPTDWPLQILRLARATGDAPSVRVLEQDSLRELLSDPFLYHSNVLDGLFHDGVIVCESDSDCRYYRASMEIQFGRVALPDLMYVQVGGKSRVRSVAQILRTLHVPTACIVDFDILNDKGTFQKLVEGLGGTWSDIAADFRTLYQSVQDPTAPTVHAFQEVFNEVVSGLKRTDRLDSQRLKTLTDVLRTKSGWSLLKRSGMAGVDRGEPWRTAERLLEYLGAIGIFPVPVGELESWHPRVGGKSGWLERVFGDNLHVEEVPAERPGFLRAVLDYFDNQRALLE